MECHVKQSFKFQVPSSKEKSHSRSIKSKTSLQLSIVSLNERVVSYVFDIINIPVHVRTIFYRYLYSHSIEPNEGAPEFRGSRLCPLPPC